MANANEPPDSIVSDVHVNTPAGTKSSVFRVYREAVVDGDGDLCPPRKGVPAHAYTSFAIAHAVATPLETVGLQVWRGALLLADWLVASGHVRKDTPIIELGAGTGLCSLVAAYAGAPLVFCTDHGDDVLENCRRNCATAAGERVRVRALDWRSDTPLLNPLFMDSQSGRQDFFWTFQDLDDLTRFSEAPLFIAADVVYDRELTYALVSFIKRVLSTFPTVRFVLTLERRVNITIEHLRVVCPARENLLAALEAASHLIEWHVDKGASLLARVPVRVVGEMHERRSATDMELWTFARRERKRKRSHHDEEMGRQKSQGLLARAEEEEEEDEEEGEEEEIGFVKMNGLGNDFVVIDLRPLNLDPSLLTTQGSRFVADRRRGIGCDQVLLMSERRDARADVFMSIVNSDGTRAEACGNGTRCVAALVMRATGKERVVVETVAGLREALRRTALADGSMAVAVDMGAPETHWRRVPLGVEQADTSRVPLRSGWIGSAVSMGNPHVTLFGDEEWGDAEVERLGRLIGGDRVLFPEGVNVGFARVMSAAEVEAKMDGTGVHLRFRVWERGAGRTEACGSGACAAVVGAVRRGLIAHVLPNSVRASVVLDGGVLHVEWAGIDGASVRMTGAAQTVFHGRLPLSRLIAH